MIRLCDKGSDYRFFCVRHGTCEISEMRVLWLFEDDDSGKKYFVFSESATPGAYYLREYRDRIEDGLYSRVPDPRVRIEINRLVAAAVRPS